jgi:hypothetical protein
MEHRYQIEAIVREVVRAESHEAGRAGFARVWGEIRRQLRALRDTATSLIEDERAALQCLRQLQTPRRPAIDPAQD